MTPAGSSASFAFTVDSSALSRFAKKRTGRGRVLVAIGLFGLIFGLFWVIWGIILILLSEHKLIGLICSIVSSGPVIAGAMALIGGVRRRSDSELCALIDVLADARGELTIEEVAHLTGHDRKELAELGRALSRDGAISPNRPAPPGLPAVVAHLGGPALRDFRDARVRRAKWLAVAAIGLMGFASFWTVVAIAGLQSKDYAPAFVLLGIAAFPWIGGIVLLLRARDHRRRAHRLARLVVSSAVRRAPTVEVLASEMRVKGGIVRETALEAAELGVVPRELIRHLSDPSFAAPANSTVHAAPLPLDAWIGRTLAGSWQVESLLARGGVGAVFRGRHVETKRPCAIKVLLPGSLGDDAVRRFEREATSASKLGHPGIVRTLDFGRSDEGASFLVMELLEGETLEARLQRQGALPWRDAVTITRAIGDALACAHDAGLLHRDIKPANIFLAQVGQNSTERAILLDFGLVKPLDETVVSRVTVSGVVAGTPLYMSPEQASGDALDVRSDVYTLAVVLYEMLTGTPPFFDRTVAQVYARLLREAAPRVDELAPGKCPPALDDALARALSRKPDDRWPTTRAFLQALERAATEPATAIGA